MIFIEEIKEERKLKMLKLTKNSRDIIQENKSQAGQYEQIKLLELLKSVHFLLWFCDELTDFDRDKSKKLDFRSRKKRK